jgi:cytochrome P450
MSYDERLTSPGYFADPYPVYRDLQREAPVYFSEALQAWLVTRYDDVSRVLRDIERFPNSIRLPRFLEQLGPEVQGEIGHLKHHFSVGLVQSDPPDHTRLRALVHKQFQAAAIEHQHGSIQSRVDSLIDQVQLGGEIDLVADLAYPLPVNVISDMVGVPVPDRQQYKAWSTQIFGFMGTGRPSLDAALRAQKGVVELEAYFRRLFDRRLSAPEQDLISDLVAIHHADPERLGEDELLALCGTFVSAGHETTTSLIANGFHALLTHPRELDRLREDPALITSAIEEVLRYESPFQRDMKVAAVDVNLHGFTITADTPVWAMLGAAHRDPEAFDNPDQFDIGRSRNRHLAFGYGPHFCLGAWLARLEGQIAIGTAVRRLRGLRLVNPVTTIEWRRDYALRGPGSLRAVFDEDTGGWESR